MFGQYHVWSECIIVPPLLRSFPSLATLGSPRSHTSRRLKHPIFHAYVTFGTRNFVVNLSPRDEAVDTERGRLPNYPTEGSYSSNKVTPPPSYSSNKVTRPPSYSSTKLLLHHDAAHLQALLWILDSACHGCQCSVFLLDIGKLNVI